MRKELREVLSNLLQFEGEPHGYVIVTIEFPCNEQSGMKVVQNAYDPALREYVTYVDTYRSDGTLEGTQSRTLQT